MPHRIEVTALSDRFDTVGSGIRAAIEKMLGKRLESVRTRRIYAIDANLSLDELSLVKKELFVDPVIETASHAENKFDWLVEIGYKAGVTDNVGKTSKSAVEGLIKRKLGADEGVYTSVVYLLRGGDIAKEDVEKASRFCLGANSLINMITIMSHADVEKGLYKTQMPVISGKSSASVMEYDLDASDEELMRLSRENVWSLSLEEMKAIRDYFAKPDVINGRKKIGLGSRPTDVEMETLAQTWSEHCKHKIFNAEIRYVDEESGKEEIVDSIFKTFIKNPSREIAERLGWVVSSFDDNAGVVRFNERLNIADKIETHNAPSALDPYGGAITGIVGVNRDPMGTGKGAKLITNVFGYCFGDPYSKKQLPEGVLHPAIIRDGVHRGVIDGGNQSGVPLGRGWEIFDDRYAFRPLVFCGTIGMMPVEINGEQSHIKKVDGGDLIVMVGGRVGKDGIHGATFSSAELNKESPVQAVQIGDPITQKKMGDFLLEARDLGLYRCITDNGAGGLSSSVGEMAELSNGCEMDLSKVPLKYHGLNPWEILLSEAQERMTVAVDPSKIKVFLELSKRRDVESTVLGIFSSDGKFRVKYGDKTVACLDMEFLHKGVPRMKLVARWKKSDGKEPTIKEPKDIGKTLEKMLSRFNICSKEVKMRQYDHEVRGLSVVKPFVGKDSDVPSDATVLKLEHGSDEGIAFAEGKNPFYSDIDTYHMAASVIDESVRRLVAIGCRLPDKDTVFYGLDNFCWNISDLRVPDGEHKLAQLVRANKALKDYCSAFGTPCISGKDSMKNVWKMKEKVNGKDVERTISIPPTLVFSARAKLHDVGKAVTMDVKAPGDLVYIVGQTKDELGGSEFYRMVGEDTTGEGFVGSNVPNVDARMAKSTYEKINKAVECNLVRSVHTPTMGGLGVALALTAFGGGCGLDIDLGKVPHSLDKNYKVLFSESNSRFIVTVPKGKRKEFEGIMKGVPCSNIGVATGEQCLKIKGIDGKCIVDSDLSRLKEAWKRTLG